MHSVCNVGYESTQAEERSDIKSRLADKLLNLYVYFFQAVSCKRKFKVVNMTVVTDIDSLMQHGRDRTLTVQGIPEEVS